MYVELAQLEGKHWWFRGRRKFLRNIIRLFFKTSGNEFCEIGCGTGGNLSMLAEFSQVDAVEKHDEAIQFVSGLNIPRLNTVRQGSLPDNIPLDKSYDGVFILDVVEHIADDFAALEDIKKYLKEDGLAVITVPAYQWLWSTHDEMNHHFRRYQLTPLNNLLVSAGYKVKYISYFNSLLFPISVIVRLFSKFFSCANQSDSSTLTMPSEKINNILLAIFGLESYLAGKMRVPFGLSIVAVVQTRKNIHEY